ncbi:hypothetical protein R2Q81_07875 [Microbacterium aquimaris]|uniref:YczE/YyaS/YitT family protein n=1 Tax=Microbacterium aquimaris TaxID=459816 RepID=UPI002AD59EFE|nr:hypothetical protein [Microbacterium aquimaris]MDZ8275865.1 hypothetical protein [Microbacterium aquimaris]
MDVLAEGVSARTGVGVGWVTNLIGFAVLLVWIPLRQRPGVGTVANILVVGSAMQGVLDLTPPVEGILWQLTVCLVGIGLVAVASGLYIGAHFGPGPRDGLMTGIHHRWGWPLFLARGGVELTVLTLGWALGGTVGVGTVMFAVLIGPLVHIAMPLLDTRPATPARA